MTTRTTTRSESDPDTIVGEATCPGRSGLAVIRLSGPDAHDVARGLFRSPTPLVPRELAVGSVSLPDGTPDKATCITWAGPRSFTGEDVAELGVHGSPWVVLSVLEAATKLGARPARPGEFSYRAYLNGRMDLTRAEALNSLIHAVSPASAAEAARQAGGSLQAETLELQGHLLDALAELEAAVDFEEDTAGQARIDESLRRAAERCGRWRKGGQRAQVLGGSLKVVLAGPPNAGKSSLFNALLAADRAIVSDEPGTTRDVLEGTLVLEGLAVTLLDTAGEREATGAVEAEGVKRALRAREEADLVLQVRDLREDGNLPPHGEASLNVLNKADLADPATLNAVDPADHVVSATQGIGLDGLLDALAARAKDLSQGEGAALLASRQRSVATQLDDSIQQALEQRTNGVSEEYVAESVRTCLDILSELAGSADVEQVYDRVFKRFCLGK